MPVKLKIKIYFMFYPLFFTFCSGYQMALTDYKKAPEQILVDLINDANPDVALDLSQVTLSNPAIVVDGTETGMSFNNRKTRMTVAAVPGSGYIEQVEVKYNRLHYRDVFPTTDSENVKYPVSTHTFDLGEHNLLSQLLPEVNEVYGLNLVANDFWEMPLPVFEGLPPYDDKFIKLEAKPESKIFIGGVTLKVNPNPFDLANMPVTTLNGLIYPSWQARVDTFVRETMDAGPGKAYW